MFLAAGLLVADAPGSDRSDELGKFQGTWKTASMEIDGRRMPDEALEQRKVIIINDRYVVIDGNRTIQRGTFRIDPSRTPKQIDTVPADGPNAGRTDRGIYEFREDGTLRMCHAPPGAERPTEFSAEAGSGRWMVLDRREAPAAREP